MQDLEKMAAKLLETARKLPPGTEQHALLEQIGIFRTKLSAVAAKRKRLQLSQEGPLQHHDHRARDRSPPRG
jgi:hypothetical protein